MDEKSDKPDDQLLPELVELTEAQLTEILERHLLHVESDGEKGEKANLKLGNLQGANLQGSYLMGVYLQGANLTDAKGLKQEQLVSAYPSVGSSLGSMLWVLKTDTV